MTCDFEKALINAVREHFRGSVINGCLFNWKQVLCRKMLALNICPGCISMEMIKHVTDVLTLIPCDEIKSKGIPYVRSILDIECDNDEEREHCNECWDYFTRN